MATSTDTNSELLSALGRNGGTYEVTFALKSGEDSNTSKFWVVSGATAPTKATVLANHADGSDVTLTKAVSEITLEDQVIGYLVVRAEGGATTENNAKIHSLSYSINIESTAKVTGTQN